jgi:hypothetical protein
MGNAAVHLGFFGWLEIFSRLYSVSHSSEESNSVRRIHDIRVGRSFSLRGLRGVGLARGCILHRMDRRCDVVGVDAEKEEATPRLPGFSLPGLDYFVSEFIAWKDYWFPFLLIWYQYWYGTGTRYQVRYTIDSIIPGTRYQVKYLSYEILLDCVYVLVGTVMLRRGQTFDPHHVHMYQVLRRERQSSLVSNSQKNCSPF